MFASLFRWFSVTKNHLFPASKELFISQWREERFIFTDNGEIHNNIVVKGCSPSDYLEILIFKESDRKSVFSIDNNYQPFCCDSRECSRGFLLAQKTDKLTRYISFGTCDNNADQFAAKKKKTKKFDQITFLNNSEPYKINTSDIYTALIANCAEGNISFSGAIEYKSSNALDFRLKCVMNSYIAFFIISLAALIGSYILISKRCPNLSFDHMCILYSYGAYMISSLLNIIFYNIWNLSTIRHHYLLFLAGDAVAVSRAMLAYVVFNTIWQPFEVSKSWIGAFCLILLYPFISDVQGIINVSQIETGNWNLGYGFFSPALFIAIVGMYTAFLFIYYNYTPQDTNTELKKQIYLNLTVTNLLIYIFVALVYTIMRMDYTMWQTKNRYHVGLLFEPIFYFLQNFLTTWYIFKQNELGYESLQENEADKANSLVMNQENEEEEDDEEEQENETLQDLKPMETV